MNDQYLKVVEALHRPADREKLAKILADYPEVIEALGSLESTPGISLMTRNEIIGKVGISKAHFTQLKAAGYIKPANSVDDRDKFSGAERYDLESVRQGIALWNIQKAFRHI